MNNPPSSVISALLISKGYFDDPEESGVEWPLYISSEPNLPDDVATIYDTTPVLEGIIQKTGELCLHYGIQLRIRSLEFVDGWVKASEVLDNINNLKNQSVTIGARSYLVRCMVPTTGVVSLGQEEKRRDLFTVNFLTSIKEN